MKQLTDYIEEKLKVNKQWKGFNKLDDNEIRNIINDHIKQIPKLNYYESIFPNSIKTELSVALHDNGLKDSFDARTENEFNKFAGKMNSYATLMRFPYGDKLTDLDYPIVTNVIREMLEDLYNEGFELETMWEDRSKGFVIEYYSGKNFFILNMGTRDSSTLFYTQREF